MRIFGFRFEARRESRWASTDDLLALSDLVQTLSEGLIDTNRAIEAMRKKVYREEKKSEVEEVLSSSLPPERQPNRLPLGPGEILSPEQVAQIFRGG